MAKYRIHDYRETFKAETPEEVITYLASKGFYTYYRMIKGEGIPPLDAHNGRKLRIHPPEHFVEDLLASGFLVEV